MYCHFKDQEKAYYRRTIGKVIFLYCVGHALKEIETKHVPEEEYISLKDGVDVGPLVKG